MFRMNDEKMQAIRMMTEIESGVVRSTFMFSESVLESMARHLDRLAKESLVNEGKDVYLAMSKFIREECADGERKSQKRD